MMTTICFLSGVGFQEILLIGLFLFFIVGIPLILILVIVKVSRRKTVSSTGSATLTNTSAQTPILKNAEKLKELKSLQERGIISSDEFESEKRKILNT